MSGFLIPPTFAPPAYGIPLGSDGEVLTMVAGVPRFAAAASGGAGGYLACTVPSGTSNDFDPGAPWPSGVGRLDLDASLGNATLTGLIAGSDGQIVYLSNIDPSFSIVLANQNTGSAAANRFRTVDDLTLVPGDTLVILYYGGAVNRWVIVT